MTAPWFIDRPSRAAAPITSHGVRAGLASTCLLSTLLAAAPHALAEEPPPQSASYATNAAAAAAQKASLEALVVEASNAWLRAYAAFPPLKKLLLTPAAVYVAKLRREALELLIRRDPERAIALSLATADRQGLPKSVLDLLETRVHATGELASWIVESLPQEPGGGPNNPPLPGDNPNAAEPPPSLTPWTARIGETTFQAFVYGLRHEHLTRFATPIHGIALDDLVAVSDRLLYRYDPFETAQLGFKPEQIVATSGDAPFVLPDIGAFVDLERVLVERLLRHGPLPYPFHPNEWTTGIKTVLAIKVRYGDDPRDVPYSDAEIAAALSEASELFVTSSRGLTSLNATVLPTPVSVLAAATYSEASSVDVGVLLLTEHALHNARIAGYDPDAYDRVVILAPEIFGEWTGGAPRSGRTVTVTGTSPDLRVTFAHELGHTYGFPHSSSHRATGPLGTDPLGPGEDLEYGDMWDLMGRAILDDTIGHPERRHFNGFFKAWAGWLPTFDVVDGTLGGDFHLYAHDTASPRGNRAIFIETDDGNSYWLDRRSQFPWNASMANGIEVRRVTRYPSSAWGPVTLIDLDQGWTPGGTPGEPAVFHSLAEGNTFRDPANGVTIRVVFVGEDHLGAFARVFIARD